MKIKTGDKLWLYAPDWAKDKRVEVVVQSSRDGQLLLAPADEAEVPGAPRCAVISKR